MRRKARVTAATAMAALVCGAGCGKTVRLGSTSPVPIRFAAPTKVAELASGHRDNPTLTADLLEIYFISNEEGQSSGDVWVAKRTSRTAAFGTPGPVPELAGPYRETSSAISADGLALWFASNRPGGSGNLDIWVAQRPTRDSGWSAPMNLVGLNTPDDDLPRPPGQHGLIMPMASTKKTPSNQLERNYQTYFATRKSLSAPFQSPALPPGLDYPNRPVVDGCLTEDGLTLFFASAADALEPLDAGVDGGATDGDIFVAYRRTTDEPFSATQPVSDVNSPGNDRDPWLSPDGTVMYFTSDRDGQTDIYSAPVVKY